MSADQRSKRPEKPIFDPDPSEDIKVFYHNLAYKVNRQAINIEKMKLLKQRLAECVRTEGVNYIDKCEQLTKRYEAAVRVVQFNVGGLQKQRNVGNIYPQWGTGSIKTGPVVGGVQAATA